MAIKGPSSLQGLCLGTLTSLWWMETSVWMPCCVGIANLGSHKNPNGLSACCLHFRRWGLATGGGAPLRHTFCSEWGWLLHKVCTLGLFPLPTPLHILLSMNPLQEHVGPRGIHGFNPISGISILCRRLWVWLQREEKRGFGVLGDPTPYIRNAFRRNPTENAATLIDCCTSRIPSFGEMVRIATLMARFRSNVFKIRRDKRHTWSPHSSCKISHKGLASYFSNTRLSCACKRLCEGVQRHLGCIRPTIASHIGCNDLLTSRCCIR